MIRLYEIEGGARGLAAGLLIGAAIGLFVLFFFVGAYTVGHWIWTVA